MASGIKERYKKKIKKLKDVIRVYQRKYHDIDMKFVHEEMCKINNIKEQQKQIIHDLE